MSAERRRLPWVKVEKEYVFGTPEGRKTLDDLFEGRSQLIVYHFMWRRDMDDRCVGCSFLADHIDGANQHLAQHDAWFVACSRASVSELNAYKKRMGWRFDWVSSYENDFNYDYHVSFKPDDLAKGEVFYNYTMSPASIEDLSGISVFYRDKKGGVFHTYSSYARGNEEVLGAYMYLDLTPKGRNENGPNHNLSDSVAPRPLWAGGIRRCHGGIRARGSQDRVVMRPRQSNVAIGSYRFDGMDKSRHESKGRPKDGIFKEYFKDGTLSCVGQYSRGEKTGEWKYYLRNGLLKAVGKFSYGKMIGEWTWYRENGEVMQIGAFNDEKKSGSWRRYHPNGALYDEGKYIADKRVGEWRTYDADGRLAKTTRHKPQ